jgi:hypothetical protein
MTLVHNFGVKGGVGCQKWGLFDSLVTLPCFCLVTFLLEQELFTFSQELFTFWETYSHFHKSYSQFPGLSQELFTFLLTLPYIFNLKM